MRLAKDVLNSPIVNSCRARLDFIECKSTLPQEVVEHSSEAQNLALRLGSEYPAFIVGILARAVFDGTTILGTA